MEDIIIERLKQLEVEKNIKILYACESGSRAWGFPSIDSDYDIRFIYIHPLDYYLSIHIDKQKDTIEMPFKDELDIAGWDLKKALDLFFRSNAAIMEWLHSPKIYIENLPVIEELRILTLDYYNLKTLRYHYYHLARKSYEHFQLSFKPNLKQFFYILRAIYSVQWIDEYEYKVIPNHFADIMEGVVQDDEIKNEISHLIKLKEQKKEKDEATEAFHLKDYINNMMRQMDDENENLVRILPDFDILDEKFRSTLKSFGDF